MVDLDLRAQQRAHDADVTAVGGRDQRGAAEAVRGGEVGPGGEDDAQHRHVAVLAAHEQRVVALGVLAIDVGAGAIRRARTASRAPERGGGDRRAPAGVGRVDLGAALQQVADRPTSPRSAAPSARAPARRLVVARRPARGDEQARRARARSRGSRAHDEPATGRVRDNAGCSVIAPAASVDLALEVLCARAFAAAALVVPGHAARGVLVATSSTCAAGTRRGRCAMALWRAVALSAWRVGGERGEAVRDLLMHPRVRRLVRAEVDVVLALPRLASTALVARPPRALRCSRGDAGPIVVAALVPSVDRRGALVHLLLPADWVVVHLVAAVAPWLRARLAPRLGARFARISASGRRRRPRRAQRPAVPRARPARRVRRRDARRERAGEAPASSATASRPARTPALLPAAAGSTCGSTSTGRCSSGGRSASRSPSRAWRSPATTPRRSSSCCAPAVRPRAGAGRAAPRGARRRRAGRRAARRAAARLSASRLRVAVDGQATGRTADGDEP